jgi:hypothetical protein
MFPLTVPQDALVDMMWPIWFNHPPTFTRVARILAYRWRAFKGTEAQGSPKALVIANGSASMVHVRVKIGGIGIPSESPTSMYKDLESFHALLIEDCIFDKAVRKGCYRVPQII